MTDSQTTTVTIAEPALFTHDGYRLYVFDGVPRMMDVDIGRRIGRTKATNIRSMIEGNISDLEFYGLVHAVSAPIPQGGRGRGRTKDGTVYYLNQEQVRWIIIQSRTPAGKELARQVLAVFDAWERGELVSRAEAAEAALARQSATMAGSVAGHHHYALEQSRFLIEGPAAMVPSDFVASVKADNRFTRIGTTLPLTITIVEDQVRIFDVDLGHAIGGECTNLVRPRVREIQSRLRLMRPDPWYEVQACRQLGHSYKMTSGSLLAHKQAKAISTIMDPDSRSEIQYRLDLLCDHFAMGRLSELVYDPPGGDGPSIPQGLRHPPQCHRTVVTARYVDAAMLNLPKDCKLTLIGYTAAAMSISVFSGLASQ